MNSADNITSGLSMAKENTMQIIHFCVDKVAVPIGAGVILLVIVMIAIGATKKHRAGDDYQEDLWKGLIAIVGLGLVISFPYWGWAMIGIGGAVA